MKKVLYLFPFITLIVIGCSNEVMETQENNSINVNNGQVVSDSISLLDSLVITINDNPDNLHLDYTPSVHELSTMGIPALDAITPLLSSTDEMTRMHAQRVMEGVIMQMNGWVTGQGYTNGGSEEIVVYILKNINYNYDITDENLRNECMYRLNIWKEKLLLKEQLFTNSTMDTVILSRTDKEEGNAIIYIDPNPLSSYYMALSDFTFDARDQEAYAADKKDFKPFKKDISHNLPTNWLPLKSYNNNFYLYKPSDWGNLGRRIVNHEAFVYWYMDGPMAYQIENVNEINEQTTELSIKYQYNDHSEKVLIHILDPITQLAVFEFETGERKFKYQLYTPVESAPLYDIIVNYSPSFKNMEFNSEVIDYTTLLNIK